MLFFAVFSFLFIFLFFGSESTWFVWFPCVLHLLGQHSNHHNSGSGNRFVRWANNWWRLYKSAMWAETSFVFSFFYVHYIQSIFCALLLSPFFFLFFFLFLFLITIFVFVFLYLSVCLFSTFFSLFIIIIFVFVCFGFICLYNRNGWLGVTHPVTYLLIWFFVLYCTSSPSVFLLHLSLT